MIDKAPQTEWDWLGLAQHHGLETRLLDWTENPLVALYFAVENCSSNSQHDSVIWMLRVPKSEIVVPSNQVSPFSVTKTKVFRPTIVSHRMTAQAGWFSVHKFLQDKNKFVSLDKNKAYKESLAKLALQLKPVAVVTHLARIGINLLSLFPDLDGLCKHLNDSTAFSISDWEFIPGPRRKGEPEPESCWQER